MEEVVLLVIIFLVDILPLVSEAFGGFLLMFPESIQISDSVYSCLPFLANLLREFLFPGIKKTLMSLKEVCFELIGKDSWNAMNDRIPGVSGGKNTCGDMNILFLKYGDFEGLTGDGNGKVAEVVFSQSFRASSYRKRA